MCFVETLSIWLATAIIHRQLMQLALALARQQTRRDMRARFLSRTPVLVAALALCFASGAAAQEPAAAPDSEPADSSGASVGGISPASAVIITPNDIMGFENSGGWGVTTNSVVSDFSVQSTTIRTQGEAAYAVNNPPSLFKLISRPVAYMASALSGIGNSGALLQLDVEIPCGSKSSNGEQAGTCESESAGWIEGYVSSKSRGLNSVSLGKVSFSKYRAGIYNTIGFTVPESVSSILDHAEFNDLVFNFDVSTPNAIKGAYLFDNLRVHSVELVQKPNGGAPPAGYGGSVDVTVTGNKPVKQSFSLDPVQIPSGLHLKTGTAGKTTVQLEAGVDSHTNFTCTYDADSSDKSGQSYKLTSCTGQNQAGDLISSNWVSVAIEGGEASQQLYAQLVLSPLGDQTGTNLLPAMPTFWGSAESCSPSPVAGKVVTESSSCSSQTAQANKIVTNYFNEVKSANPTPGWIVAPVPDSAKRSADGTPTNFVTDAKTSAAPEDSSDDVTFNTGGDLNPGGSFDAYWKLSGDLTPTAVSGTDENLTQFDAAFTAHGVLFGSDIDVVDAKLTADTDSGETTPAYKPATSSGTLGFYVLGEEIPSNGLTFTPSQGFNVDPSWSQEYDLPPIQIWIFDITLGALVDANLKAEGSASLSGADLSVTPSASLGAHISGGVDLGLVKGDVDAKVNLITLSTPITAQAKWVIDNDPGICADTLDGSLTGDLDVSSGGGQVDLEATFGDCPLCYTDSYTLFKWGALESKSYTLFNDSISTQLFGLPASMCKYPITVKIASPSSGASLSASLPQTLAGAAKPNESTLPYTATYNWTFTPGANAGHYTINAGANTANPTVTFDPPTSGNSSTWTIGLTATTTVRSAGGAVITETASATPVTITVTNLSPGDHIFVSSANNGPATVLPNSRGVLNVGNVPGTITFSGIVADATGTPNTTFTVAPCTWRTLPLECAATAPSTTLTTVGANTSTPYAAWTGFQGGSYLVNMTTTIGTSVFSNTSAVIYGTVLF
jgi:hypothetical protein